MSLRLAERPWWAEATVVLVLGMKYLASNLRISNFSEMGLSVELLESIAKMGINKPTEIQARAIPLGLKGGDLAAIAQTGSGKTLAFALIVLSALEKNSTSRAVVLAPSREMAQQIHSVLSQLSAQLPLTVALVVGGAAAEKQEKLLKKNPRIVVATPGRLFDHLCRNKLLLQNVSMLVIDEADRMLDMGFAPQLRNIQKTLRGQWQTLMFSASFPLAVEVIAETFLREPAHILRTEKAEKPVQGLKQTVLFLNRDVKNDRLLDELNLTKGSVMVFTGDQETCERVGEYLKSYGFAVGFIHGGLSQGQRNRVVRDFRSGTLRVLVTTDLLARGLDIPNLECVMSFDLPFHGEDFLHRIGRTARAGRDGHAITFLTPYDAKKYKRIQTYLKGAREIKVDPRFKFIERPRAR